MMGSVSGLVVVVFCFALSSQQETVSSIHGALFVKFVKKPPLPQMQKSRAGHKTFVPYFQATRTANALVLNTLSTPFRRILLHSKTVLRKTADSEVCGFFQSNCCFWTATLLPSLSFVRVLCTINKIPFTRCCVGVQRAYIVCQITAWLDVTDG